MPDQTEINELRETERSELREYVARALRNEALWTRAWSCLHHSFLFSAAILSAIAALVLQLDTFIENDKVRADWAALSAASASLIGVISVSGGFARKWRANRMTKAELEQIEIHLMNLDCDPAKIRTRLAEMKRIHHLAIVGEEESAKSTDTK